MLKTGKDWGYEVVFCETASHVAKILFMREDGVIDWHCHEDKEQTLCVADGVVRICTTVECDILLSGRSINIRPNLLHRVEAIQEATIVELSMKDDPEVVISQLEELVGAK